MSDALSNSSEVVEITEKREFKERRLQTLRVMLRTPTSIIGILIILVWITIALTVQFWAPYNPLGQDVMNRLQPSTIQHFFGTDYLGRDVFSRVLYGARISLPIALSVSGVSLLFGSFMGALAGYWGGIFDEIVMRLSDITLAFPAIVLAMAIVTATGPGLTNAAIAMIIVGWPQYARIIRAQVLSVKEREHVLAARAIGVPSMQILTRHIVPLTVSPLIVVATLDMGNVLLLAAALSFIGLGAAPPTPEWGLMVAEGRTKFLQWWISGYPGLAIMSLVLGFNFIGDSLRDALDPRARTEKR